MADNLPLKSATKVRLGTRGSPLARWQADWVTAELQKRGVEVEQVLITTQGDVRTGPLGQIGGQGLFTKEIQRALLDGRIDLAVHSLKDLPTAPIEGLALAAVPERETTGDVLVCSQSLIAAGQTSLANLPPAARVGTGSLRRKAQMLHLRPDLLISDIRGNVDSRLRKLDEGSYDAIVLAEAGLKRLGLGDRISSIIPAEQMLPAVGQGALGLETRSEDIATQAAIFPLNDLASHQAILAERAMLAALRGGCLAPVGAQAIVVSDKLTLYGVVLSGDGKTRVYASHSASLTAAISLGQQVAEDLLSQGAAELIHQSRQLDTGHDE